MNIQIFQYSNDSKELAFLSGAGWTKSYYDDFPEEVKSAIQTINDHAMSLRPIEERRLEEARKEQERLASENASIKKEKDKLEGTIATSKAATDGYRKMLEKATELAGGVMRLASELPVYEVGHTYQAGDVFSKGTSMFIVIQAHTSQADWVPGQVPALYREIEAVETTGAVSEFVQPTGAHDAYHKGDRVLYKGQVYESLIDANTYAPDAYPQGWKRAE